MAACEYVTQGGGGILPFSATLSERLQRVLLIETRLHRAVEENALRLVLQPKLDLRSERVVGPGGIGALARPRAWFCSAV